MSRALDASARRKAGAACRAQGRGGAPLRNARPSVSSKPVLYVCNVEEGSADKGNAFSAKVFERAKEEGAKAVVVSAKIESEIAVLDAAEQKDYLDAIGLAEPGLNRVIRAGYELLGLITYFTVGPEGGARLDRHEGHTRPAGRRRHPYRFREGLHPRRDDRLSGLRCPQGRGGRPRCRQAPPRRQGIPRPGRRRVAFPLQYLKEA